MIRNKKWRGMESQRFIEWKTKVCRGNSVYQNEKRGMAERHFLQ